MSAGILCFLIGGLQINFATVRADGALAAAAPSPR
jgi:hypothetical protein